MIDRKHVAMLACALIVGGAQAQDSAASVAAARGELGFSYLLGIGDQSVSYSERSSLLPVRSKATTHSPLIVSGALYAINRDLLFSLDSQFTFAAGSATEDWTATSSNFNGQTLTSRLVQTNGFSLSQNTTDLLGHYRVAQDWFAVGGAALHTQTFKRYGFAQGVDKAAALPADRTVEESTSEALADIGIALEPGRVRDEPMHYGLRALLAVPMWRRTDNTQSPGVHFKSASGLDVSLEGRCSWRIHDGIHAGLWGQWLDSRRNRSVVGQLELPDSRTRTLSVGLELLWKL